MTSVVSTDIEILLNDKAFLEQDAVIDGDEEKSTVFDDSSDGGDSSSEDESTEQSKLLPAGPKQNNKLICAGDTNYDTVLMEKENGKSDSANKENEIQINRDMVRIPPPFTKSIQSALQIAGGIVLATAACKVAQSVNDLIVWDEPSDYSDPEDNTDHQTSKYDTCHQTLTADKETVTNTGSNMSEKSVACALQIAGGVAIAAAAWNPAPVFHMSRNLTRSKSLLNRKSRSRGNTPKSSPKSHRRARSTTPTPPDKRDQPRTDFLNQRCEYVQF